MTRHQRRKLARARKDANAERINSRALALLRDEQRKRNLMERKPKRSPKGMGNSSLWDGTRYLHGYGTGAFKEKPLSERYLREQRALDKQR